MDTTNVDGDAMNNPMLGSADPLIGLQQLSPSDVANATGHHHHQHASSSDMAAWNVTNFSPQNQMDM